LPVVQEPCTLPAVLGTHGSLPGLPRRLPATLRLDGEGVLVVADCAMMYSANLSSLEFISL